MPKGPDKDQSPKVHNTDWGEMACTVNNRCETCGRKNHTRESCRLFGNPMANNSNTKWQFSQVGKAWQAIGLHEWTLGRHLKGSVPHNTTLTSLFLRTTSTPTSPIRIIHRSSKKSSLSIMHGTHNIEQSKTATTIATTNNIIIETLTARIPTIMPTMKSQIRTTRDHEVSTNSTSSPY